MVEYENKFKLGDITLPLFVQSFLGLLMGNINVLMLSHLSNKAVGAVGVANQIIGMLSVIYSVISMGAVILITQNLGAEKPKMAKYFSVMSIKISVCLGFMFSLILLIFGRFLLKLMNLPDEMIPYATVYIRIVGGMSFLQAGITIFSAILRSYGYVKLPMYVTLLMNIINVLGNFISLYKPMGMPVLGVTGVAISSVISSIVGITIIMYKTIRGLNISFTPKSLMEFDWKSIKLLMKVGGPAAGEYISYSLAQIVVTYIITNLGSDAINTRIYVQNITSFVSVISFSIGQGTQIIMGYMKGSGKIGDMHKTCVRSLKIGAIANFTLAVIIYAFSGRLIGMYTANSYIIEISKTILIVDIFLEIGRAFNHVVGNALRGTGDVRYPVIISVCSMWIICVFLSLVFGINLNGGLVGIWIASGLDEWLRGILLLKRWHSKKWLKIKLV